MGDTTIMPKSKLLNVHSYALLQLLKIKRKLWPRQFQNKDKYNRSASLLIKSVNRGHEKATGRRHSMFDVYLDVKCRAQAQLNEALSSDFRNFRRTSICEQL